MVYIVMNNGVYGLTKGQFSATADRGSKSKKGAINNDSPVDLVALALQLGATFVARSFSGDRRQLVPLLQAALCHRGFAFLDVVSPCVTFNDHEGSTKSYAYVKEHDEVLGEVTFIPYFEDINVEYEAGATTQVKMHDGSHLMLRKLNEEHNPADKMSAQAVLHETARRGEFATGVIYIEPDKENFFDSLNIVDEPLFSLPQDRVRPPKAVLDQLMDALR